MSGRHHEYIVDKILPCREIHLIGGASGSNKTTLIFQMLKKWSAGEDVFGCKSFPAPYVYVACERSGDSTQRTLERCSMELACPIISRLDHPKWREESDGFVPIAAHVAHEHPDTRLIVIDGFQSLVPEGKINDYKTVAAFMIRAAAIARKHDWTVIGSAHATKVKEGEKFLDPRQRILGSVAWAGYSETVIVIESSDPESPDSQRIVQIMPRNAAQIRLTADLSSDGLLEFMDPMDHVSRSDKTWQATLEAINTMEHEDQFTFRLLADRAAVTDRYLRKHRQQLLDTGLIVEVPGGQGLYQRQRTQ